MVFGLVAYIFSDLKTGIAIRCLWLMVLERSGKSMSFGALLVKDLCWKRVKDCEGAGGGRMFVTCSGRKRFGLSLTPARSATGHVNLTSWIHADLIHTAHAMPQMCSTCKEIANH